MRRAGNLYERVTFQEPATVDDGQGGREDGWTTRFTVRAEYLRLRGGETVQASRLEGNQPTVITVRVSSDTALITTGWRAVDARSGETFNIMTKVRTDDRLWFELTCESGVAT